MNNPVEDFFNGPNDAERIRLRRSLVQRARRVRVNGWDDYQYVWPSGEVAGVAYLLQDDTVMNEMGETEPAVLSRYAYGLYGIRGGDRERATGWTGTRAWFATARTELHR